MGIGRNNGEGYYDPTAHYAIRNMEEQEKVLRITYPSGYMDIRLEAFFPATLDRARKLFRLVGRYSSEEDKRRIQNCLCKKEKRYQSQMQTFERNAGQAEKKGDKRYWDSRFREAEHLLKRTRRNMELLQEMTGTEEGQA